MPINFEKKSIYTIDYELLYKFLNKFDIFKNKDIQSGYLSDWLALLKRYDKLSISNINNLVYNLPSTCFLYYFYYDSILLRVNFNVSNLVTLAQLNPPINFESKYFSVELENSCSFFWNKPSTFIKNINNTNPIVAVPFYLAPTSKYLIVDGNHRIARALKFDVPIIQISILSNKDLIDKKYFLSEFDFYLYVFINELTQMLNYRLTQKIFYSDKRLLAKSYLKSKRFSFKNDL